MRTGRIVYAPEPAARLQAPSPLPTIAEHPKVAFAVGWWAGIACGFVIGAGAAVAFVPLVL